MRPAGSATRSGSLDARQPPGGSARPRQQVRVAPAAAEGGIGLGANPAAAARARIEHAERREPVERGRVPRREAVLLLHRVEVEAEPGQILAHVEAPLGPRALGVEVFEAQQEARASCARVEPGEQPGEQRAGVRAAGGGRCEA